MRTFILSAVVMTDDNVYVSDRSVAYELRSIAARMLPGQAIVSDVSLTEVVGDTGRVWEADSVPSVDAPEAPAEDDGPTTEAFAAAEVPAGAAEVMSGWPQG